MNANTIRVYVLQAPEFYQAFKEYNETAAKPLYLIHGVYINEADVLEYQDAYAEDGPCMEMHASNRQKATRAACIRSTFPVMSSGGYWA